jgi:hypothetical protein
MLKAGDTYGLEGLNQCLILNVLPPARRENVAYIAMLASVVKPSCLQVICCNEEVNCICGSFTCVTGSWYCLRGVGN